MVPGRVTAIIPSRNEEFFAATVKDVLAKAEGDLEVIAVHEGYWAHDLPDDPRVRHLHHGHAKGMRHAINAAAAMATGEFLLKSDAHCLWDQGFDVKLKSDYHEQNWILIPRRYALEPRSWTIDTSNKKYPVDYHSLSEPFERHGDSVPGLHGTPWTARREARKHIPVDDELSTQGSAWFMGREHFDRIGPMDPKRYGVFWLEAQEIGLKTWLSGGAMKVTKNTFYAHLFKGTRFTRGYSTRDMGHEHATAYCSWFWMTDQPFEGKTRTFRSLLEQFWPVPTWPADLDAVFARARREFSNPYVHPVSPKEVDMAAAVVVTSAKYGVGKKDGEYLDVTKLIRKRLQATGASIKVSNDTLGVAAYRPYRGQRKRLWVEYTVNGKPAAVDATERTTLTIPA